MNTLVIDASVAGKWFLPPIGEPYSDLAIVLLNRYAKGEVRFIVPDLFWAEIGNIFWKAVVRGRWEQASAATALSAIREQSFPTFPTKMLLDDAFSISTSFGRSVYDGLYLALALSAKTTLITADERLANAVAAHLPVKWLGTLA